jgi:hypothetical protein
VSVIDAYRDELEAMHAELEEEQQLHGSGRKSTLDLSRVYARYPDMVSLDRLRELREEGAPLELQRFAAEAYLGDAVKDLDDQLGNLERSLVVRAWGEDVPYLAVRPRIINEPDADRRAALFQARVEATISELNPVLWEKGQRERDILPGLGAETMLDLYHGFGYRPQELAEQTDAFLADTEALYRDEVDRALRRGVGLPLESSGPQDLVRLWRAPEFDSTFPADRAVHALRATLSGMGIELDRQPNVELDVDVRPGKRPRAFCSPVRVPDRVVLVVLPQGGHDDYRALFHEAGHMEHFAHTSRALPAEDRLLGDNGVTEGWAFLLEHLVGDPAWLAARLDVPKAGDYVRLTALTKLALIRRYAAKLRYETELHGGDLLDRMPARYAELLEMAMLVPYPPGDHLDDVDPGFYSTNYLRAWAFEAQMVEFLRGEFGMDWFRRRAAGSLLRELWELGQSLNTEQLLREVTGQPLDFGVLTEQLHEQLA